MKKVAIILAFVAGLFVFLSNFVEINATLDDKESTEVSTISKIWEAESAGADISSLADQFNYATSLYETQAEGSKSCGSDKACDEANKIFESIQDEATALKNNSADRSTAATAGLVAYSIAAGAATTFVIMFAYKLAKHYRLKRFMRMEIQDLSEI
jgi:hypothetical protein